MTENEPEIAVEFEAEEIVPPLDRKQPAIVNEVNEQQQKKTNEDTNHDADANDNSQVIPQQTINSEDSAILVMVATTRPHLEQNQTATNSHRFPAPFYCPLTKKVMRDPVVAFSDGISYERSAKEDAAAAAAAAVHLDHPSLGVTPPDAVASAEKLYPNRALASIIEERVALQGTSMRAGWLRWQKSMRQSMQQVLVEKSIIPTDQYRPLPNAFYCPITLDLIHIPVIDPEGNTFEKAAIVHWIRANGKSPLSRKRLSEDDLIPNHAMEELLNEEKGRWNDSMHPSIRKWKDNHDDDEAAALSHVEDPGQWGRLYPTSPAELELRRQQRRRDAVYQTAGICFCILLIAMAVIFVPGYLIAWIVCCCGCFCCYASLNLVEDEA